jgi:uncharacterized protein
MISPEQFKSFSQFFESNEYISFAYIFGSRATETNRPDSDYDIAFYPADKFLKIANKIDKHSVQSSIELELEKLLKTEKLDLVNLDTASPLLRYKVIKNGKLILEKNPFLHRSKVARWVMEYLDLKPFLEQRNKIALENFKAGKNVTR